MENEYFCKFVAALNPNFSISHQHRRHIAFAVIPTLKEKWTQLTIFKKKLVNFGRSSFLIGMTLKNVDALDICYGRNNGLWAIMETLALPVI